MALMIIAYLLLMAGGVLHGAREYVHKMPNVFHLFFPKIKDVSFFGAKMWKMKNKPQNRFVKQLLQIFPVNDFWHSAHYLDKALTFAGVLMASAINNDWFNLQGKYLVLILASIVIHSFWGGFIYWIIGSLVKNKNKK